MWYPPIEPYRSGTLDVGDGNSLYWEECGNPTGLPAVVLHGGPGSGAVPEYRRYFDPEAYRIVLFDQRGSGRSTPHASEPTTDLGVNTTAHLVRDIEVLRTRLEIDRWLGFGVSWGATLALAYAEQHPERVRALVLGLVTTTSAAEVEWITRGLGQHFPEAWKRFCDGVPEHERGGNLAAAYARLLASTDPSVRERAARAWCEWEDALVKLDPDQPSNPRYDDPRFRLAFARIVTHYFSHAAFLEDGALLRDAHRLAGIPGVLVHGRRDLGSPVEIAERLAAAWPDARLVLVDDEGHSAVGDGIADALAAATRSFVAPRG